MWLGCVCSLVSNRHLQGQWGPDWHLCLYLYACELAQTQGCSMGRCWWSKDACLGFEQCKGWAQWGAGWVAISLSALTILKGDELMINGPCTVFMQSLKFLFQDFRFQIHSDLSYLTVMTSPQCSNGAHIEQAISALKNPYTSKGLVSPCFSVFFSHSPFTLAVHHKQSFLPFADNYSPPWSRMMASFIWVLQPQQLDLIWPNVINMFFHDLEKAALCPQRGLQGFNLMFYSEDFFDPIRLIRSPHKKMLVLSVVAGKGKVQQWMTIHVWFCGILGAYTYLFDHLAHQAALACAQSQLSCAVPPPACLDTEWKDSHPVGLFQYVPHIDNSLPVLTTTDLLPEKIMFDLKVTLLYKVPSVPSSLLLSSHAVMLSSSHQTWPW